MRIAARFAADGWSKGLINLETGRWNGEARLAMHKLREPLGWREPSTVFTNSMSDLFYEGFEDSDIDLVVAVMIICCLRIGGPGHVFQTLTKRPDRMRRYFADPNTQERVARAAGKMMEDSDAWFYLVADRKESLVHPRLWWGVSVENQAAADERVAELLATPAAVRFLSCEPLIDTLDLARWLPECRCYGEFSRSHNPTRGCPRHGVDSRNHQLAWLIAGAESGPGARPADHAWFRSLRDQCRAAGVSYFVKQLVVDGKLRKDIADFPADLQIQEFPEVPRG